MTIDDLAEWFAEPRLGTKDGAGWMPVNIAIGQRNAERVKSISYLALDIEADAESVKNEAGEPQRDPLGDIIKRVIGTEPPSVDEMFAEVTLHGWRCLLHTSYSHGGAILPEGEEHPRYRMIFDLSRSLLPKELKPLGLHVAGLIGIADCFDAPCLDPARLFYTPRCPTQERKQLYRQALAKGEPLDVDKMLKEVKLIEAAQKSKSAKQYLPETKSVIAAFNAQADIGQILEEHGYKPKGSRRWLWPGSTTGLPGVRILPGNGKDKLVYSSHSGDPLNDGHAHDAFDCLRILQYSGDMPRAVHEAARLIGIKRAAVAGNNTLSESHSSGNDQTLTEDSADKRIEPIPLPKLPTVPEFSIELLPDALAPWISDAASRAKFRTDFAAVVSMAALGSLIGRKLGIRLKQWDDWTEYGNVWAGVIGPPSALKSPAMRAAMHAFKSLQINADDQHAKEHEAYQIQLETFKLRKDAKKKSAVKALSKNADATIDLGDLITPDMPISRTYWTSDATAERLGELLAENPNGLLVERDELSSLLVTLEDERSATARGLYLSGWSGQEGYRFDRIMRGKTFLPKFALSVVGGIQPGPLARYVRNAFSGERADGLLQRFQLLVWPDPESFEYIDRNPNQKAKEAAKVLFERIDSFDAEAIGCHDKFGNNPPFIHLSDAAQVLFVDWYTAFMQERRSQDFDGTESAPISAHFGKYPGLLGKLALILHVADDPNSCEVSERTFLKALAWIDYLMPHARRVYHSVAHPETGAAELMLSKLKRDELPPFFKAWQITRKGWHGLTDRDAVKKACRLLFEYGWLIEIDEVLATGGRPADPVYAVSPAAELH